MHLRRVPGRWRSCQERFPVRSFFLSPVAWWSWSLKGSIGPPLSGSSTQSVSLVSGTLAQPRLHWLVWSRFYGNALPLSGWAINKTNQTHPHKHPVAFKNKAIFTKIYEVICVFVSCHLPVWALPPCVSSRWAAGYVFWSRRAGNGGSRSGLRRARLILSATAPSAPGRQREHRWSAFQPQCPQ